MKRLRGIAVLTALVAGLAACGDSLGPDTDQGTDQAARLAHYRQVWSAAEITDYQMTVKQKGEWFTGSAVIQVRNGVPVSVMHLTEKGVTWHPAAFESLDTVEELFAIIQRGIEGGADHLAVNYDRRRGLPLSASIDHSRRADDAHGFVIEDFRILR